MSVSVIIPQYKHYDLLHNRLFDLYKFCSPDVDEIVIVDDYSQNADLDNYFENGMGMKFFPTKVIRNEENLGFLKSCNRGVNEASGDIIILLSNDVTVKDNFVKQVKEKIEENERVLIGNRLLSGDTGWNRFGSTVYPYLEGWLLCCVKKIWEELGGFDEIYGHSDFEDVDISTTAIANGVALVSLDNSRVTHLHPASSYGYNPEREARTKRNRKLFEAKWVKE